MKSCALTGHRELPPDFDEYALVEQLENLIKEGYREFLCGMAQGFDLLALSHLVRLKKEYSIFIEACIPFEGQEKNYLSKDRALYRKLLAECDRKSVIFPHYVNGCFLVRDRYLIDGANAVLAYCRKKQGGTAYTVNYAKEKGLPVYFL